LIRGEIVLMSPISEPHVAGVSLTTDAIKAAFGPGFYVRVQAPINLGDSDPEPDVAVVTGGPRETLVTPTSALLIVEVSDTSRDYDTTTKAELYATAGVLDYWVLDLEHRQLLVFRDPVALPAGLGATAYSTHLTLGPDETVSPLAAPTAVVKIGDLLP
jgi:Uma2 family endonuclease